MTSQHANHRSTLLDGVRGMAVLAMITAHAIYFFHTGSNQILSRVENLGNTVAFTIFIFIAGAIASKYIDKYRHVSLRNRFLHTIKYVSVVYVGYLIVGILGVLTNVPHFDSNVLSNKILGVISMLGPINITEYIPVFIILPFVLLIATPLYRIVRSSLIYLIIFAAISYGLGMLLYPIQLPSILNGIKELFAGGQDALRFPILFYMPVYLFGIWWEHNIEDRGDSVGNEKKQVYLFIASILVTSAGILLAKNFDIPILNPTTRWPPSLGFLSIGLSSAIILIFLGSLLPRPAILKPFYKLIIYLGRDAYDIWITHLVFLFTYREFIGTHFENIFSVIFLVIIFIITTVFLSSITLTNSVSISHFGHIAIVPSGETKFRKRYGVMAVLVTALLVFSYYINPIKSTYGETMNTNSISIFDRPRSNSKIILTSERIWHLKSGPKHNSVNLSLQVIDPENGKGLKINPTTVTFLFPNGTKNLMPTTQTDTILGYSIPAIDLPVGEIELSVQLSDKFNILKSNTVKIINTEPLTVAWTFDWEGSDAVDSALLDINLLSKEFGDIPFTHFVNPRTFISPLVPENRGDSIKKFLLERNKIGDEIALHIHMQYDLVTAAGIPVKTTPHWGYKSDEGYDVPTTSYTPIQFRQIVIYSKNLLESYGFKNIKGYRAGGWYISNEQLSALKELGFDYDASGRDKPISGAFKNTPWNLPFGMQPYFPFPDNQNVPSPSAEGILEIPTSGVTFELSSTELINRIRFVYTEGALKSPKALVYISHPQYASQEFSKIPEVLKELHKLTADNDLGPVVFVNTSDIYNLWKNLLK